ncbi:MAG: TraB/GumN family protein [Sphingobium sp.]
MKIRLSSLIAFGLLCLSGCARAEAPTPAMIHADPALWVVKDKDTTIYLFGSVHLLKPNIVWFDGKVKAAFDQSGELVTEMIAPDPAEMAAAVAKLAVNSDGPATSSLLTPEARTKYLAALANLNLSAATLDRVDPWMAAITLSIAPLEKLGYASDSGVDDQLMAAAKAAHKKQAGLETVEQQLGYFDSLPRPLQIKYLNATVDELPGVEQQFADLITSWSRGNVDAIATEMNGSLESTPELAKVLLYDRNARWAKWIGARMKQPGTVFVAVGAGHLAGQRSVIDDLAKAGFKVKRVTQGDPKPK